ncbi:PREDICTED: uncharacterized protein LOC109236446 [Nicotiana attenuata]|uniref:uncharacterized protein LOC109236446 n=1 Tax=Nicotiana attenuata TaxID=49451 RepID=UPI0009053C3B|nr:PREDICTED: uncharacterized protein LOC109236446 [Nicotiana attenuata]
MVADFQFGFRVRNQLATVVKFLTDVPEEMYCYNESISDFSFYRQSIIKVLYKRKNTTRTLEKRRVTRFMSLVSSSNIASLYILLTDSRDYFKECGTGKAIENLLGSIIILDFFS